METNKSVSDLCAEHKLEYRQLAEKAGLDEQRVLAIVLGRWTPSPAERDRRTIYLIAKRNLRLPFQEVFDAPTLATSCPRRETSTHAPQALELLNGRLANDLAAAFAARLRREAGGVPSQTVHGPVGGGQRRLRGNRIEQAGQDRIEQLIGIDHVHPATGAHDEIQVVVFGAPAASSDVDVNTDDVDVEVVLPLMAGGIAPISDPQPKLR